MPKITVDLEPENIDEAVKQLISNLEKENKRLKKQVADLEKEIADHKEVMQRVREVEDAIIDAGFGPPGACEW